MKLPAVILLCAAVLTGCAGTQHTAQPEHTQQSSSSSSFAQFLRALAGPGPGLASHDPPAGTPLFSQIPAWDRAAERRCCSALPRAEFISSRCDTDAPLGGRTNRC